MREYYEKLKEHSVLCAFCKSSTNLFSIKKHLSSKKCIEFQKIKISSDAQYLNNYLLLLEYCKKYNQLYDNDGDEIYINRILHDIDNLKDELNINYDDNIDNE